MADMKAIRIHQYGGPEVLVYEDVPRPVIAEDEILVKVEASAVNPIDWKIRQGYVSGWLKHELPLILGAELSGTVEEAGARVSNVKVGDEVIAYPSLARCGAYAEFIAVKAYEAALKPQTKGFPEAAALIIGALTAWQAFDLGGLEAGQRVLIHAAAGGVGSLAVQLAKIRGAYVIGTASARNADYVKALGADEVIDYTAKPFEEAVSEVDMVFDLIGGETQERSYPVLKKGGAMISAVQPPNAERVKENGGRAAMVAAQADPQQFAQVAAWADEGRLNAEVAKVFPLSEAREAQELSQTGRTRGKIILTT